MKKHKNILAEAVGLATIVIQCITGYLRHSVSAGRLAGKQTVNDQLQLPAIPKIQTPVSHGNKAYDLRKAGAKMKDLPQFVTIIEGIDIKYVHSDFENPNATPFIIIQGLPNPSSN